MHLSIERLDHATGDLLGLEIVERKGLGHPDTICDKIAEQVGRALSRVYLAKSGQVLHHNVDMALLVGGVSRPAFGAGEVIKPMALYLAGRATSSFDGTELPILEIARGAALDWLR
jgi:S-adenosylmethionine synthetase